MTGRAVVIGGGCADITAICAAMHGAQILSVERIGAFGGITAVRLEGLYDLLCSWGSETVYQKGG